MNRETLKEMEKKISKVRITLTIEEDIAKKIDVASRKYGIPKTSFIVLATLEKINKEEKNID